MGLAAFERFGRLSARSTSYALAIVLPILSSIITSRVAALNGLPFALHFVAMAVVATLGGLAPAIVSVTTSLLARFFIQPFSYVWPLPMIEVVRPAVLFASAVVISLVTRQRRQTAEALEIALNTLQEKSHALMDSQQASKCASWTYDSRDRTRWIPGGYEVFGRPFEEIERLPSLLELILPEDRSLVRNALVKMTTAGAPLHVEYRTLWPNGDLHWSEARGNPVSGDPNLWRGVTFDITDRKLAEEALVRSEKLAAMGRLASTVAHEINNPLEAAINLVYLARSESVLDPTVREYLILAEKELARLGNITRLTLGFVRTSTRREDVVIAEVLEEVLSIFHHRMEMNNIRVERSIESAVQVSIAPHELRQIVVNLVANATDALSAPDARLFVAIEQFGPTAVLRIEDNGSGIAESYLKRVFEPFFTTKADVGTGIGLWVTRELVEKNGGTISAKSGELPNGLRTSFRIELPASQTLVSPQDAGGKPAEQIAV